MKMTPKRKNQIKKEAEKLVKSLRGKGYDWPEIQTILHLGRQEVFLESDIEDAKRRKS